ncbi:MAG: heterodisulfide reductase-related iron-sulfur binding cluster [Isosphaeraceae bacterium]
MASAATETPATNPAPRPDPGKNPPAGVDLAWLSEKIEYQRYQDCVHCGLCTASCPTYLETGNENDGPRGRIYLMRAVADGRLAMSDQVRGHLDLCLDCRACETACPSGVKYGQIIEPFKIALQQTAPPEKRSWLRNLILRDLFPYTGRVKFALAPARLLQKVGVMQLADKVGLNRLLPTTLRRMQAMLPDGLESGAKLPEVLPAIGPKRATVALFLGCVADAMFPATNSATARVLQKNGCDVHVPSQQACCGAIHYHSGFEKPALELMRQNLRAFDPDRYDAIIINAAGCGSMLKDYAHILHGDPDEPAARKFLAKVKDISEFLYQLGPIAPKKPMPIRVTYHDACHLCHGQQIRNQPRALLQMIPGLELVSLDESEICCGAAGTYNLTQPEMSERLGRRKMDMIEKTRAATVATGNVGCILQIARKVKERGLKIRVAHPIDLLDEAYGDP